MRDSITALITADCLDEKEAVSLSESWCARFPLHPATVHLLMLLASNGGRRTKYLQVVVDWLRQHLEHRRVPEVFLGALKASANHPEIRELVAEWIKKHPSCPDVPLLLMALAKASEEVARTQAMRVAISWLRENMNQQPTQALMVLISIISSGGGFKKEVLAVVEAWCSQYGSDVTITDLLLPLAHRSQEQPSYRRPVIEWLKRNRHHPNAVSVLYSLVKAQAGSQDVRELAYEWIRLNPDNSDASNILVGLARAGYDKKRLKGVCQRWLASGPSTVSRIAVISAMIKVYPELGKMREYALQCLESELPDVYFRQLCDTLLSPA
jgi:hypothetical protein